MSKTYITDIAVKEENLDVLRQQGKNWFRLRWGWNFPPKLWIFAEAKRVNWAIQGVLLMWYRPC